MSGRVKKPGTSRSGITEEARYRAVLASVGEGVISTDAQGRIEFMNPVAERLTGWTEAEARGRPLAEVFRSVDEETRREVDSPIARVQRDGVAVGLANHALLIAKDSTERAIAGSGAPIRDEAGVFLGVVLTVRDQTEEREARKSLAEAHAFAESIIATVREPLLVLDGELRVVKANRSFLRQFQVAPEMTDERLLCELGNGQWDVPGLRRLLETVLKQETVVEDHEITLEFPDIGRRTMLLNARRISSEAGQTRMILLAIEDITERTQAAETRKRRDYFENLFDHGNAPIVVWDPRFRIVRLNRAFEILTGRKADEVVGQSLEVLFQPDQAQSSMDLMAQTLTGRRWETTEIGILRSDGSERIVLWNSATIVSPEGGTPVATVALGQDVTEQRSAEEELISSREQLRALAARLLVVREEERTFIARQVHDLLAQDLTRLKIDLAWLRGRLARNGTIAMQGLDARVAEMGQRADAAIHCVQKIATELRPALLDSLGLCAVVEWQAHDFQNHSGIQCRASVPEEEPLVDRDSATAAFRILQESLTNVQRHANATRVDVLLRCEADRLLLRVQDNGSGIESAALRSPMSIGLTGMRERALLLGGQLDIHGLPGAGTTVEFRLPLSRTENPQEARR